MAGQRYVEENGSPDMLAAKRLSIGTPELNLREPLICMPP